MRPRIELIYDRDCPNIAATRKVLLRALAEKGLPASWTEWDRRAAESPPYVTPYPSPTILVNGRAVSGPGEGEGAESCRLYDHGSAGLRGVPPVALVVRALQGSGDSASSGSRRAGGSLWRAFASLPGFIVAVLPIGKCPACWPAYAGLLSSLGLGFLLESVALLPLMVAFFTAALLALAYRARSRRGYGPLGLGALASAAVVAGKFVLEVDLLVYAGLALFVAASLWNAWPHRVVVPDGCPDCMAGRGPEQSMPS